jgi:ferredoxin, 2Fe-2S type, ISC system
MTRIVVLPHAEICPKGTTIEARKGESICQSLVDNGIPIDHACGMSCACTTCHIIVREGFDALAPSDEFEDDLLDRAWGLEPNSRLSCQTIINDIPLVIEIPRYSINMAKENER